MWYSKKWVSVTVHAVAWIALFLLPFLLRTSYSNNQQRSSPSIGTGYVYFYSVTCLFWVGFFYLNTFLLFPQFILKKKLLLYVSAQVLFIAILFFLHWIFFLLLVSDRSFMAVNFFLFNLFPYLFILAASTAYSMILDKIQNDKLVQEKENENLKTELSFLRSQVSPHFMFNVLNNMVALARKQSAQLEPSLIKLSSLMRYMLYEADEDKVPLEKEIEYLQSFIDLQQQRFGKNVKLNVSINDTDRNYDIEPMLLIPFVENAFKHGAGLVEDAQIDIDLRAKNNLLQFSVRNKYNRGTEEIKDKTSGIGLTNAKRRLNLLYGKNHTLLINKNGCWFTISLQLNLH